MAVSGLIFTIAAWWAATKAISAMGGDPEAAVAEEAELYQGLTGIQQASPLHKMRQRLAAEEEMGGALAREAGEFEEGAREVALGRRITGGRELLESISRQLGTTPEDLGRRLSPTRMGDYSSVSKAAFGRSAKRMGPNG